MVSSKQIIANIFSNFIRYNNRLIREGSSYINRDTDRYRGDIRILCLLINLLNYNNRRIDITNEEITMSLGSEKYIDNIYHLLDGFVVYILQNMILETCNDEYIYYVYQYNNKMNRNLYIEY
jgi:hypothetical protein